MNKTLSKTCEYCGKVFYQKNTQQSEKSFLTRKYCSYTCSNKARARKPKEHKEKSWVYPKTCLQCGKEFWPRDYDSRPQFAKRKFCSHACAYKARTDHTRHTKTCIFCGKTFEKRKNETIPDFNERKFCSQECANVSRRKKPKSAVTKTIKRRKPHSFKIYVNNM